MPRIADWICAEIDKCEDEKRLRGTLAWMFKVEEAEEK
jgi:hypothetical protein